MSKIDLLFEALREANPARDESSPIPDIDEVLSDHGPTWARPQARRRWNWRPWLIAPVMFLAVMVPGLLLLLDRQTPSELPPATSVNSTVPQLDWCNVEGLDYEIDPAAPASIESGYRGILAIDLVRASLAPESIADEAELVAEHSRRLVAELERNDWDLAVVDTSASPEVGEARAVLDEFTRERCGG